MHLGLDDAVKIGFFASFAIMALLSVFMRQGKRERNVFDGTIIPLGPRARSKADRWFAIFSGLFLIAILAFFPFLARQQADIVFPELTSAAASLALAYWVLASIKLPDFARFLAPIALSCCVSILVLQVLAIASGILVQASIERKSDGDPYCFYAAGMAPNIFYEMTFLTMRDTRPFFFRKYPGDYHATLVIPATRHQFYWSWGKLGFVNGDDNISFPQCLYSENKK